MPLRLDGVNVRRLGAVQGVIDEVAAFAAVGGREFRIHEFDAEHTQRARPAHEDPLQAEHVRPVVVRVLEEATEVEGIIFAEISP